MERTEANEALMRQLALDIDVALNGTDHSEPRRYCYVLAVSDSGEDFCTPGRVVFVSNSKPDAARDLLEYSADLVAFGDSELLKY